MLPYLKAAYDRQQTNQKNRSDRMKAARAKGNHSKCEWEEMKYFFENTCVRCFGSSGYTHLDKDHIVPVYQGGSNGLDNIQPLCPFCNSSKGSENIDHRINYCLKKGILLPEKYKQITKVKND